MPTFPICRPRRIFSSRVIEEIEGCRCFVDYSSSNLIGGERVGETQPVLGVVVDQLVASVSHHRKEKATLELLTRKLASLPELSTVELQEVRGLLESYV